MGVGMGVGNLMAGVMGQTLAAKSTAAALCPACRAENQPGARFCASCGKSMAVSTCPKCRTELASGARFCSACGEKLGS